MTSYQSSKLVIFITLFIDISLTNNTSLPTLSSQLPSNDNSETLPSESTFLIDSDTKETKNNVTLLDPVLACISSKNTDFKFTLTTRRNSSGHWLADMDVNPGLWRPSKHESPFEVHLEHRTHSCIACDSSPQPHAHISIIEPPPVRAPAAAGYRHFAGFGFYKRHLQQLSWREARAVCREEGADLVVINSEQEAKVLLEMSAPLLYLQPADAWNAEAYVGLYDFHHEGNFIAVDGTPLNETGYVQWNPGEPNNHREEDCVTIVRNAMYNDVVCSKTFEFICEVPE